MKELKNCRCHVVINCGGKAQGPPISNTQTIWQLSDGEENLILALIINILWDVADSITYLVPTQFQD
jgi:hypothetical protein